MSICLKKSYSNRVEVNIAIFSFEFERKVQRKNMKFHFFKLQLPSVYNQSALKMVT